MLSEFISDSSNYFRAKLTEFIYDWAFDRDFDWAFGWAFDRAFDRAFDQQATAPPTVVPTDIPTARSVQCLDMATIIGMAPFCILVYTHVCMSVRIHVCKHVGTQMYTHGLRLSACAPRRACMNGCVHTEPNTDVHSFV